MANIKDLGIDQITDLYIKVLKPVKVYSKVYGTATEWTGWTYQGGQIVGKLWSWIDGNNTAGFARGLWMMFKSVDGSQTYYIKVEPKTLDWAFIEPQLDARRKQNMSWYNGIFDDVETALNDYVDDVKSYVENAMVVGGVFLAIIAYWQLIGKYQVQAKVFQSVLRTTVKELKQ